jgi:electron transfer flavoprotein alpha subunit
MLFCSPVGCLGLQVLVADSDVFAHPLAEPWAELLRSVQQKGAYSHVIASSTSFGKNLLPRAAALLDVSPVTDVTAISEPRVFVRFDIFYLFCVCLAVL